MLTGALEIRKSNRNKGKEKRAVKHLFAVATRLLSTKKIYHKQEKTGNEKGTKNTPAQSNSREQNLLHLRLLKGQTRVRSRKNAKGVVTTIGGGRLKEGGGKQKK